MYKWKDDMKHPGYEPELICAQGWCGSHHKWPRNCWLQLRPLNHHTKLSVNIELFKCHLRTISLNMLKIITLSFIIMLICVKYVSNMLSDFNYSFSRILVHGKVPSDSINTEGALYKCFINITVLVVLLFLFFLLFYYYCVFVA